jgi:threonine dehydratase
MLEWVEIAASSGNHGQAVAYAAAQLGISATVVMPETRREDCRRWGAEVLIQGATSAQSMDWVAEAVSRTRQMEIPTYDSEYIIAATGTVALEIREGPNVGEIWVPISGGGLISGIAAAVKAHRLEGDSRCEAPAGNRSGRFHGLLSHPCRY